MIDAGPGVDDSEPADPRSYIDYSACHHDGPCADCDVGGDDRAWMNQRREFPAGRHDQLSECASRGGIADADNEPVGGNEARQECARGPFDCNVWRSCGEVVVEKASKHLSCSSRDVGDDAAVATASDDLQG